MAVSDANVFPGILTPVLTQLLFAKPPTTFLTCYAEVGGKNTLEESSPQPGIKLTTTRS